MAAVVSHAMRRLPTSPPDTAYSSYGLRGESSTKNWSNTDDRESALSRSMRYADPWLYGSVRASPGGLLLAPAFVLCTCSDYVNGTKRSNKKSPSTCKKCKGTRLPLSQLDSTKFGTVRCYPTSHATTTSTPLRAGTVRVNSSSRPSILPSADPYDLMRRSRLSVSESTSQFRARSISPTKNKSNDTRSHSGSRKKGISDAYNSTLGRRSILECDINPYDLMSCDAETKDKSITFVNGQRIRVRPHIVDQEYEDVQLRRAPTQSPPSAVSTITLTPSLSGSLTSSSPKQSSQNSNRPTKNLISNGISSSSSASSKISEKESECNNNRFKSILKKRATTFNDTDTNGPERTPSPALKSGSHFYIPMPCNTPRKKVQFLVENELVSHDTINRKDDTNYDNVDNNYEDDVFEENEQKHFIASKIRDTEKEPCKLRRSVSERFTHEQTKVIFNDTMALRTRSYRSDARTAFAEKDLERLDGISSRKRKVSPNKPRPNVPPPPPPASDITDENILKPVIEKSSLPEIVQIPEKDEIITEHTTDLTDSTNLQAIKIQSQEKSSTDHQEVVKQVKCSDTKNTKVNNQTVVIKSQEISIIDFNGAAPSAPPRKRSNNKQPQINISNTSPKQSLGINSPTTTCVSPTNDCSNKTVVQVNGSQAVHKLKIKNEFTDITNIQTVSVLENPQRKTSILINGDDCYSTVNVNDDIPLYQSSVVVKDSGLEFTITSPHNNNKKISSSVYITGSFTVNNDDNPSHMQNEFNSSKSTTIENNPTNITKESNDTKSTETILNIAKIKNKSNDKTTDCNIVETFTECNIPSSDTLKELLKDPVEAVRRNLVPHVCGKSDMHRRPLDSKSFNTNLPFHSLIEAQSDNANNNYSSNINPPLNTTDDPLRLLRNYESITNNDDVCSEHSSSTQYELMDPGSDCYTDHSNRSSVTEEELANRTKFYELLADSAIEVFDSDEHHYESIKINPDPIYEEIEIPPPLPANPPPSSLLDDLQLDKEYTTRSIFEGASKYDILSYLVDAKERGIVKEDSYTFNFANTGVTTEEETKEPYNRVSHMSTVSDSSEDNSLIITGAIIDDKANFQKAAEVERNDSGVGSETSKSSLSKYRTKQETFSSCEDCESVIESKADSEPLICRKCIKKRSERKEIITEIVETEEKYSRDLQIILEEFYQPMLVAGLLTPEQLSAIFLNAEELLENSQALAERLRDAVEIALEQGDDDLLTVNIGKLFLEAAPMLHAFETYCVRQGAASLLLASLEKEKELLRIFLKVSQMENTMLRRMNLNSFLMVPVQRVTKYPLLLARLFKVTPSHHDTREQLKEAQHKIELHLNHMNSETKDVPSKLWRRIGSNSGRRSSAEMDLVNIKLRKIAVDVLEWNHDEAKFALEGKLLFTQPTDNNWRKGRTIKLAPVNALLVINGKQVTNKTEKNEDNPLVFSRQSGIREAALLLVRDKNGRYSLLREPLYLDRCVIAADPAWQSYFEVQELLGKDTFIFKAEDDDQTHIWYKQLQYYAQGMGAWRKRRNALANIMINGMGLRS